MPLSRRLTVYRVGISISWTTIYLATPALHRDSSTECAAWAGCGRPPVRSIPSCNRACGIPAETYDAGATGSGLLAGIQRLLPVGINPPRSQGEAHRIRPIAPRCLRGWLEEVRAAVEPPHSCAARDNNVATAGDHPLGVRKGSVG